MINPRPQRTPKNPALHSFSLVEMLVAMTILLIITGLLLSMTGSMMSSWTTDSARNERRTIGRTVFERMSRDLGQTTLPLSRGSSNSLEFIINPTTVSAAYQLPQAVFWQAPVTTDGATNGDLAEVGYFVQWADGGPVLSRLLVNPSEANYLIYKTPTSWISDTILLNSAPSTASAGYSGLLAKNVMGLWVQALDPSGNPIQQASHLTGENFDSRLAYPYTNSIYPTAISTNSAAALPASLQVAIIVIDSRTAKLLKGTEKPSSTSLSGNFWADINSFYSSLSPRIQQGAVIQSTVIQLSPGPR